MAKKPTTGKITRRDAVAMLGAGTIVGVVRPAAQGPASPASTMQGEPSCNDPADVTAYNYGTRQAFVSYSCCFETKNAILVAVQERGFQATTRGKMHLEPVRDRLVADRLDEYCYMIWGLNKEQLQQLTKSVPDQLKLTKREVPKTKK